MFSFKTTGSKHSYLGAAIALGVSVFAFPKAWSQLSEHEDMPLAETQSIIYEETFAGKSPFSTAHSIEIATEHAFKVVTKPGYPTDRAARFELRESDPMVKRGTRAEVVIVKGEEGHIGRDTWYAFDIFLPSDDFEDEEDTDLINQWHQDGFATTSIRVKNGKFQLKTGASNKDMRTFDLGAAEKDKWHNFVIHFIHSNDKDGLIDLWLNSEKVLSYIGGNMYRGRLPKWKIGIYKSTWNESKTNTDLRVLYYDNIRVASGSLL